MKGILSLGQKIGETNSVLEKDTDGNRDFHTTQPVLILNVELQGIHRHWGPHFGLKK